LTAGDVYRALWRHKLFILLLTAVFVGATWYVTSRQTRTYEASTLVRVQERGDTGNAALLAAQTLAQTYASIIGSGALEEGIATLVAACASGNPSSLKGILPVAPRGAPNAAAAKGFRAAYRRTCRSIGVTRGNRVSPRKVSKVDLSGDPVEDLDLLSIAGRSTNRTNATIAVNAAPWALRGFIRKTGSSSEKIVTVKTATKPRSPVSEQLPLKIAIAVMLGLIFNGALALLLELFRDRLPDPDQLGREVGVPVLATIPALRLHQATDLAAARHEPNSASTEQSRDGERSADRTGPRIGPEP
jgi:receptor protein-tyrosine kinase